MKAAELCAMSSNSSYIDSDAVMQCKCGFHVGIFSKSKRRAVEFVVWPMEFMQFPKWAGKQPIQKPLLMRVHRVSLIVMALCSVRDWNLVKYYNLVDKRSNIQPVNTQHCSIVLYMPNAWLFGSNKLLLLPLLPRWFCHSNERTSKSKRWKGAVCSGDEERTWQIKT